MYSFPRISGEYNVTGYTAFFFLPKSAIADIGDRLDSIVSQINYSGSPDWFAGYSVQQKLLFKDEPTASNAGINYPVSLSGTAPVDKPEFLTLFEEMVHEEFIVLLKDNNGRVKLLGTLEKGLKFNYKTEGVGYTFSFTGDYDFPPPFYSGNFTVDGTVVGSVLSPAGIYIRASRWIFGMGMPASNVGQTWDVYVDNQTTNYYSKDTGAWVYQGQLVDQALQILSYMYSTLSLTGNI
ncbi:hypothetical protein QQ054_32065 [Oscillatoria amoena NRMC-F 0135]|nr:hypothetical protein [Oscillatoria amoena NRMC-F 0135]